MSRSEFEAWADAAEGLEGHYHLRSYYCGDGRGGGGGALWKWKWKDMLWDEVRFRGVDFGMA